MTPQAQDIVDRFKPLVNPYHSGSQRHKDNNKRDKRAIESAIVAVDMIVEATKTYVDRPEYSGDVYDQKWLSILTELKNQL